MLKVLAQQETEFAPFNGYYYGYTLFSKAVKPHPGPRPISNILNGHLLCCVHANTGCSFIDFKRCNDYYVLEYLELARRQSKLCPK